MDKDLFIDEYLGDWAHQIDDDFERRTEDLYGWKFQDKNSMAWRKMVKVGKASMWYILCHRN